MIRPSFDKEREAVTVQALVRALARLIGRLVPPPMRSFDGLRRSTAARGAAGSPAVDEKGER